MEDTILKNRLLKIPLTVLYWCGFVTFENRKFQLFNKIKSHILLVTYCIYVSKEIFTLFILHNDRISHITINLSNILFYISICIKAWIFIKYRKQFTELFTTVDKDIRLLIETYGQEENKILDDHIKHSKIVLRLLHANTVSAALLCGLFYIFICFISEK